MTDPVGVPWSFEEWLALLDGEEPTDVDVGAAEILQDFREHGER